MQGNHRMPVVAQKPHNLSAGIVFSDGGRPKKFVRSNPSVAQKRRGGVLPPANRNRWGVNDASPFWIHHAGIAGSLDFIFKNHQSPVNITDLVRVARMSRRGFLKAFVKHTGGTPGRMLRAVRVEHAKVLLLCSLNGPESIALHCGFRSLNSFMVSFKRDVGIAPIQFRRQARRLMEMCGVNINVISNHCTISNPLCRNLDGNH